MEATMEGSQAQQGGDVVHCPAYQYIPSTSEIHPLQNPVVLSRIFELCPQKQLANYRLVSKLWYKLSLDSWRKTVKLVFKGSLQEHTFADDVTLFWIPNCDEDSTSLQVFTKYVQDLQSECFTKPYRKFCFRELKIGGIGSDVPPFLKLYGHFITSLELRRCYFEDLESFRTVMYKAMPNLKRLLLKHYRFPWRLVNQVEEEKYEGAKYGEHLNLKALSIDMDHEPMPVSWLELFSHYPKLESLRLYNASQEDAVVQKMLSVIKTIRKHDKRKLVLKHLDILSASIYAQDAISPSVCQLLREVQLPLETLIIDFGAFTRDSIIHDILDTHSGTLKRLSVYRGPISMPYPNFPFGINLSALQEIEMSDRLSESMGFLKFTPNLRKLNICDVIDDVPPIVATEIVCNTWPHELENVRLEHLTNLKFDYVCSKDDLKMLIKAMPNVTTLRMPLDNEKFRVVCKYWTDMEDLTVLGNELDAVGLTGMSMTLALKFRPGKPPPKIPANIKNLKRLRSFTMENDNIVPTKLIDNCAHNGFLLLPNLQRLRISAQMTERTISALKAAIPDCKVRQIRYRIEESEEEDWC